MTGFPMADWFSYGRFSMGVGLEGENHTKGHPDILVNRPNIMLTRYLLVDHSFVILIFKRPIISMASD